MSWGEIPGGNLRAYYKMENANDSSGNGFNLTNTGSVPFNSGRFNNGADFGTTGDKSLSSATHPLSTAKPTNVFISFWFKLNSTSNTSNLFMFTLISGASDATGELMQVYYAISGGTLSLKARFGISGAEQVLTATADTNWHFVKLLKTSSTQMVFVFDRQETTSTRGSFAGVPTGLSIGNGLLLGVQSYAAFDQVIISESLYCETGPSERIKLITYEKGIFAI